jgi:hypothetical protein
MRPEVVIGKVIAARAAGAQLRHHMTGCFAAKDG